MARKKKVTKKTKTEEHGEMDVLESLDALDDIWDDIDEPPDFEDIPDGKYIVQIKSGLINHSKGSGRLQCSWEMKIADGPHRGRSLFKHDGMDNDQSLSYFRGGLARLGMEWPEKAGELPNVIGELEGTFAQVTAKTKGADAIQNVYFNKALDNDEIEELAIEDNELPEDFESDIEVGSRISAEVDGDTYEGEVTAINDETADITFDDGDELTLNIEDLTLIPEESDEEEEVDETEEEGEEEDEVTESEEEDGDSDVKISFDDDKITSAMQKKIAKAASELDFNPDDYETWTDLLVDMGEYVGLGGEYDKPKPLLDDITESLS